ncbi:hypothetical protein ACIBG8_40460 [Nonomuraea sp. NPDC050556]|uniref:hypothetical protein n=1 Tax=Nonomuraea sp. NPDC050556 TaxID=3364369 RepID=UPI0037BE0844
MYALEYVPYLALGARSLWPIYVLAFLLACVDPLYQPAFRAILPSLVPVERLPPANARIHIGEHAVNLFGPIAGAWLIVTFGYRVAVFADAGTFVLSAALISFACNFGVWLLLANVVYYLTSYHCFTPGQIGVVYAFQGAGAVVGGLSMLLMIPARGPVLIGLAWLGQFAGAGISIVATATLRQVLVPDRLLGRVLGSARMIAFASIPLAAFVTGVFETVVRDAYLLMGFAGVSWLVVAGLAARSSLRRVELEPSVP